MTKSYLLAVTLWLVGVLAFPKARFAEKHEREADAVAEFRLLAQGADGSDKLLLFERNFRNYGELLILRRRDSTGSFEALKPELPAEQIRSYLDRLKLSSLAYQPWILEARWSQKRKTFDIILMLSFESERDLYIPCKWTTMHGLVLSDVGQWKLSAPGEKGLNLEPEE